MGQRARGTVLIVEDDQCCSELITEVVQDLGFSCRVHDRAERTLALIRLERPVLVLDVMLPDGDGVGVLRSMRQDRDPVGLPVLLCTAALFHYPDRRLPAGDLHTARITKPFHIEAFGRMVLGLLGTPATATALPWHP